MALPSSGAIRIGQYSRELLVRSTPYNPSAATKYITLGMSNTYFRYITGATTVGSVLSMSNGYGKYGLPKSARLALTNTYTFDGYQFTHGPDNTIYAVGSFVDPNYSPSRTFGWVAKLTNTAIGGTAVAWAKYTTNILGEYIKSIRYVSGLLYCVTDDGSGPVPSVLILNASDGSINSQFNFYNTSAFPLVYDINVNPVDNSYYITGHATVSGGMGNDGMIYKFDGAGNFVKLIAFGAVADGRPQVFFKSTLNGTNIASVGYTSHNAIVERGLVVVHDFDGNVVWWKYITSPDGSSSTQRLASVAFDSSGYVNVVGYWRVSGVDRAFIARFDTVGNLVWARTVGDTFSAGVRYTGISFNTTDGFLYVSGYVSVNFAMLVTAVYNPADGTLLRFRVRESGGNGPSNDFMLAERGDPIFDTQGNVVYMVRHQTTASVKGKLFIREKLYSDTSAGLREALGYSQTPPDPDAEYILDNNGTAYYSTITTTQTIPPFFSYYSFFTFSDLVVGTNISVAADSISGYIFTGGTVISTAVNNLTLSDLPMYANSQYYIA